MAASADGRCGCIALAVSSWVIVVTALEWLGFGALLGDDVGRDNNKNANEDGNNVDQQKSYIKCCCGSWKDITLRIINTNVAEVVNVTNMEGGKNCLQSFLD
jgi:curli biogenesis system outer membrane secretion channel CsgG